MTEVSTFDCQLGWLISCSRDHVRSEMLVYESPGQIMVHCDTQLHNLWSAGRQSLCLSVSTLCLTIAEAHSRFSLPIDFQQRLSSTQTSCEPISGRNVQCPVWSLTTKALYALILNVVVQRYLAVDTKHVIAGLHSRWHFVIECSVPNATCHLPVASKEDPVSFSRMRKPDLRNDHSRSQPKQLQFQY